MTIQLFGLNIFSSKKSELLKKITQGLKEPKLRIIFTPNPEQIVLSRRNPEFFINLQQADYLIPDGVGLVLASRLIGLLRKQPAIPERIAGRELVVDLLNLAQAKNLKVLLIGGHNLKINYKQITWVEGFKQIKRPKPAEQQGLEELISKLKPEVVFVALGAPYQEDWLVNNKKLLKQNKVKLAMAVGGSFDYLTGKVVKCPEWLAEIGLEWLFRLVTQPWRIFRQTRLISFIILVIKELVVS